MGGVRSKLPDGSGPDRTPLPPPYPTVGAALPRAESTARKSTARAHQKEVTFSRRNFGDVGSPIITALIRFGKTHSRSGSLAIEVAPALVDRVSRFWLTYRDLAGRPLGVVILDSPSLPLARLQVAAEGLDHGATFCDGHELEGDSATLVPPSAIGRTLPPEEAVRIIRRIERWIPKRAAAASVTWRVSFLTRAGG